MSAVAALWEFVVVPACRDAFVRAYGPDGDWAVLFARGEGFVRTELWHDADDADRFVTVDVWRARADRDAFLARFAEAYRELDDRCAALTVREREIGLFTLIGAPAP